MVGDIVQQLRLRLVVFRSKALLCILKYNLKSRSFSSNFYLAGFYAKQRVQDLYGTENSPPTDDKAANILVQDLYGTENRGKLSASEQTVSDQREIIYRKLEFP